MAIMIGVSERMRFWTMQACRCSHRRRLRFHGRRNQKCQFRRWGVCGKGAQTERCLRWIWWLRKRKERRCLSRRLRLHRPRRQTANSQRLSACASSSRRRGSGCPTSSPTKMVVHTSISPHQTASRRGGFMQSRHQRRVSG